MERISKVVLSSPETELEHFLRDPKQKVLALQGPWGIGKTFFWKDFIKEEIARKRASLFIRHFVRSVFGRSDEENMIVAGAVTTGAKKPALFWRQFGRPKN